MTSEDSDKDKRSSKYDDHPHSETAKRNSEARKKGKVRGDEVQKHENRENPMSDHVPGHTGYDRSNVDNVINTPRRRT